jgi:glucose dehydrogenase
MHPSPCSSASLPEPTDTLPVLLPALPLIVLLALLVAASPTPVEGRQSNQPSHEWWHWGGTPSAARYAPLDQIRRENFRELEVAWVWRGDNFGPDPDWTLRSTPVYAGGRLFTVAGTRRTVAALDPATGETLWIFREPATPRWEASPRTTYGKGVSYAEVEGRGVIFYVSPALFLHALDAETGRPVEGFGSPVPVPGFEDLRPVDLLADLDRAHPWDPVHGPDPALGALTNSSPPLVVNGVVIVGNSSHVGLGYSRMENIPGDVLAYDARTGKHLWRFHVLPRPGEVGHDSWENDAWAWSGNANPWAPFSADPERGIVYIPTGAPTNDVYGGFRPGDNLFGTSVVALDLRTGERRWHFQTVRHDVWDRDNPHPPILLDLQVEGRAVPAAVQVTKQGLVFAFHRGTGEPLWPVEDVPVPASQVPGERLSPTQPIPSRPAPFEIQGLSEEEVVDFTPELRAEALELLRDIRMGPLFNPPIQRDNPDGYRAAAICPGFTGGANIIGGAAADPETGVLYVASVKTCNGAVLVPGSDRDDGSPGANLGRTVVDWIQGPGAGFGTLEGIPLLRPPWGRITAIDMNTGDHLWWIPNGDTPAHVANHPRLEGIELPNTGQLSHATVLVTSTLLLYGEGRSGLPRFHAVDKATGERVGTVEIPAPTTTAPMTFLHEGRQYIVTAVGAPGRFPGSLVGLRLP